MKKFIQVFENICIRNLNEEFTDEELFMLRKILSFEVTRTDVLKLHEIVNERKHIKKDESGSWCNVICSLKNNINFNYFKWPHQTDEQALMGHLFFPVQLEYINETYSELRTRVQNLLAISAFYKNTLAQLKMKEILDREYPLAESVASYFGDSPNIFFGANDDKKETNNDEDDRERNISFEVYFGKEDFNRLETYKNKGGAPCYFGGFLDIGSAVSRGYFKSGWIKNKDVMCGNYYVGSLKDGHRRDEVSEEIVKLHRGIGFMIMADRPGDRNKRIELYLNAGKNGIADGYYSAGILAGCVSSRDAIKYYSLAAENYILRAYDKLSEIHFSVGFGEKLELQRRLSIEYFTKKGDSGDEEGYIQAGKLCLSIDAEEERAVSYFEKAGLRGYHALKDTQIWRDSKEYYEKRYQKEEVKRYTDLLELAIDGPRSPNCGWIAIEHVNEMDCQGCICTSKKKENILKFISEKYTFEDDVDPDGINKPDVHNLTRLQAIGELRRNNCMSYDGNGASFTIKIERIKMV